MNAKEIVYCVQSVKTGEPIYDCNSALIGYFTGYSTRPTANSTGSVEFEVANGNTGWISGKAVYVVGMGLKFVENYVYEFNI